MLSVDELRVVGRTAEAHVRATVARAKVELVHRGVPSRPFRSGRGARFLFVTEEQAIARGQIFPFLFFEREIAARWGIQLREVALARFEARPDAAPSGADVVVLQTWFDVSVERLRGILDTIQRHYPAARVVFFDSFAPTDLRLAAALDATVSLYVKKHVLRDRSRYSVPTRGDTNLTDFYGRLYGIQQDEVHFAVSPQFLEKLRVGPTFFTASNMLPRFYSRPAPPGGNRPLDLHGRLASKGTDWYGRMRSEAIAAMESLRDLRIVSAAGVSRNAYLKELAASKMCFSPFGYGEVCWRDYEAVMCGALLIKPDMGHCETAPDIFVPHVTYVPVRWDFSDVEEKVRHYLKHDSERQQIVQRAYSLLHDYCAHGGFLDQMRSVFELSAARASR